MNNAQPVILEGDPDLSPHLSGISARPQADLRRAYVVCSTVVGVITDLVYATSRHEAITLVTQGRGDTIGKSFDSSQKPLSITADPEPLVPLESPADA